MQISIDSRQQDDRTVVEVSGEVDVSTADALDAKLTELTDAGATDLVVDLSKVEFLDSTGLGVLVKTLKHVREHDGSLAVVASSERIAKVFRITGLDSAMPLSATVDEALS